MAKIEEKVEQLLAKHPSLTRPEATKIITAKNTRKRDKRSEKNNRINEKIKLHESKARWDKSQQNAPARRHHKNVEQRIAVVLSCLLKERYRCWSLLTLEARRVSERRMWRNAATRASNTENIFIIGAMPV